MDSLEGGFELVEPGSSPTPLEEELPPQSNVLWRVWNTAVSRLSEYGGRRVPTVVPEEHTRTDSYKRVQPSVERLIDTPGHRAESEDVRLYLLHLYQVKGFRFHSALDFLHYSPGQMSVGKPSEVLRDRLKSICEEDEGSKGRLLLVPYLQPGHIMMIAVDFSQETVEFFCSVGRQAKELGDSGCTQFDLEEDLRVLWTLAFNGEPEDAKLLQIPGGRSVQDDTHSCGIWAMLFAENRLQHDFESTLRTLAKVEDIYAERDRIGKEIAASVDVESSVPVPEWAKRGCDWVPTEADEGEASDADYAVDDFELSDDEDET